MTKDDIGELVGIAGTWTSDPDRQRALIDRFLAGRLQAEGNTMIENVNCDGSGPHMPGEVRPFPLGCGGSAILCKRCWARKNVFNFNRGQETGEPDNWPRHSWNKCFHGKVTTK